MQRFWIRLVQTSFHLLYTLFAPLYDHVAWLVSRGDWQAWGQASLAHIRPDERVLELGCGPGHLLPRLATHAPLAIGLDRSAAMLRLAADRKGDAYLVRGTGDALPFTTAAFGTVVAAFPAPYIAQPATLDEIQRVLGTDGRLVIVDGAELSGHTPHSALVNLAYSITSRPLGETPLPRRLQARGFVLSYHQQATRYGRALVLVADKAMRSVGEAMEE